MKHKFCGRNSAVECQLPKLDVAGSIPVARSKKTKSGLNVASSSLFTRSYAIQLGRRRFSLSEKVL